VAGCPIVRGILRFVGQGWYSPHYEWKQRVLRWFREAGFSDPYIPDEPICVWGQKVPAP
jgi:hypothetical protein